ncbi:MAG: Na/Pi cotransporter family protein [Clostridia bacterium]|nr:Na/Pi cotransporter family protein [Clostridia bacterium]
MDVFTLLSLIGGIAMFLLGMHQMGLSLEKAAGPGLSGMLERMTRGKTRAMLLGLIITAVMQSSSTTTVMVVGFVNSGIMKLAQAIPVIMGANVGTTVTSWILSLAGIESTNFWISLLKPTTFTPVLAVIGVAMMMFSKNARRRDTGGVFAGFAILMYGMDMMTSTVKPLAGDPAFQSLFLMFDNPWLGLLTGAVLTAVIQSSSASVGILQALAATGAITNGIALPIIMGQNIGTCVTALLGSVGANVNARRTAMVHLVFNIIGSLLFMVIFLIIRPYMAFFDVTTSLLGIAVIHTIFNVLTTGMLLPFAGQLERLVIRMIPEKKDDSYEVMIDERLLATPTFALNRCRELMAEMSSLAHNSVVDAIGLMENYDSSVADNVEKMEDAADEYEDKLGSFALKLNHLSLSASEGRDVTKILHGIGDFERISDHAVNLMETAREIHDKGIVFTDEAKEELKVLYLAVRDILDMAADAYNRDDIALARRVEPLEEVVDELIDELKLRHVHRLLAGTCTVETGFVFGDLLTNLERVADHCSNLAVCVIELSEGEYNAHAYIQRTSSMSDFAIEFQKDSGKYALPKESNRSQSSNDA